MGNQTIFKVDKTTPKNKIVLGSIREYSEISSMDCHLCLCSKGYRTQEIYA
jgi:hypothetical protein